jgi:hypothetical protein
MGAIVMIIAASRAPTGNNDFLPRISTMITPRNGAKNKDVERSQHDSPISKPAPIISQRFSFFKKIATHSIAATIGSTESDSGSSDCECIESCGENATNAAPTTDAGKREKL